MKINKGNLTVQTTLLNQIQLTHQCLYDTLHHMKIPTTMLYTEVEVIYKRVRKIIQNMIILPVTLPNADTIFTVLSLTDSLVNLQ